RRCPSYSSNSLTAQKHTAACTGAVGTTLIIPQVIISHPIISESPLLRAAYADDRTKENDGTRVHCRKAFSRHVVSAEMRKTERVGSREGRSFMSAGSAPLKVAAFGAQRQHVTLATGFRSPSENSHSRYGYLKVRFAPKETLPVRSRKRCGRDANVQTPASDRSGRGQGNCRKNLTRREACATMFPQQREWAHEDCA